LLITPSVLTPLAGYLAKTNTNDDSCFSRYSNEETVPQPCLKRRVCRVFFEHNLLLRTFGRLGFDACDRNRKPIFLAAFALSMLGWVFSIAATFAYTMSEQATKDVAWGVGDVGDGSKAFYVGLEQLVVEDLSGGDAVRTTSVAWVGESACTAPVTFQAKSLGGALVTAPDGVMPNCRSCRDVAVYTCIRLVIASCITQVFQITTNLQRTTRYGKRGVVMLALYFAAPVVPPESPPPFRTRPPPASCRYGDLNCQKMFGFTTSVYGLVNTLRALSVFRANCGLAATILPPWALTSSLSVIIAGKGAPAQVDVVMTAGPGLTLLWLASLLKFFDALAHLVVPTPPERHRPMPSSSGAGAEHPW